MKPILDRLIIKQHVPDERTKGGIMLPASVQGAKPTGVVVAAGPDTKDVREGDVVLFNNNYHMEFRNPQDGQVYVTVNEQDVLAVLEDGECAVSQTSDKSAVQVVK